MKKETLENINKSLFRAIGMSYDEYEKLDFDEQQRLMSEYHKKHPNKSKEVTAMIDGGDESIFIEVPRGEEVLTTSGYYIAGETLEENKKRWQQKVKTFLQIKKEQKLISSNSSKLSKSCNYEMEEYSPLAYDKFEKEQGLILKKTKK